MFSEVTLFKYNVSTILSPIVGIGRWSGGRAREPAWQAFPREFADLETLATQAREHGKLYFLKQFKIFSWKGNEKEETKQSKNYTKITRKRHETSMFTYLL